MDATIEPGDYIEPIPGVYDTDVAPGIYICDDVRLPPEGTMCFQCGNWWNVPGSRMIEVRGLTPGPGFSGFCVCGWRKVHRPGRWIEDHLKIDVSVKEDA